MPASGDDYFVNLYRVSVSCLCIGYGIIWRMWRDFRYLTATMGFHAKFIHKRSKRKDYLHGILRLRKDALIILSDEPYALALKPFKGILWREVME